MNSAGGPLVLELMTGVIPTDLKRRTGCQSFAGQALQRKKRSLAYPAALDQVHSNLAEPATLVRAHGSAFGLTHVVYGSEPKQCAEQYLVRRCPDHAPACRSQTRSCATLPGTGAQRPSAREQSKWGTAAPAALQLRRSRAAAMEAICRSLHDRATQTPICAHFCNLVPAHWLL